MRERITIFFPLLEVRKLLAANEVYGGDAKEEIALKLMLFAEPFIQKLTVVSRIF